MAFGTCLYFALEDWLRDGGCRGLMAEGGGEGTPFLARAGFDFKEPTLHPAILSRLKKIGYSSGVRYPFQVLDLAVPGVDSYRLLQDNAFGFKKLFDGWPTELDSAAQQARRKAKCH